MKKVMIIILVSFCLMILKSNAQVLKTNSSKGGQYITAESLLLKSKTQKKNAWILLGIGAGIGAIGGIVQLQHQDDFDFSGAVIAIIGGAVALSSIPLFISSAKNARKAATMAISMQQIFSPNINELVTKYQPAFTLKIKLSGK